MQKAHAIMKCRAYRTHTSMIMASDTVTDCTDLTVRTDEAVSPVQQDLEDRLGTLTDNINLCNQVLNDFKELRGVLVRKSLQDAPLPPQK